MLRMAAALILLLSTPAIASESSVSPAMALGVTRPAVWRWRTGERSLPPYLWLALWAIERSAVKPRR